MMTNPGPARSRAFLVGLVAGAVGATVTLLLAVLGAIVGVPLLLIGIFIPPRLYGAAGTLIGLGGALTVLFGRVALTCRPPECVGPSATPFVIAGITCLAIGLTIGAVAVLRDRRAC
jgi:hypothetical protein